VAEQDLTIRAKAEGTEQAAADVEKISEATGRLDGSTKKQADATDAATDAQGKLNAAEEDYIGLLAEVSPALAQFADGLLKGSKVAGDFATKNIDLGKALGTATSAAKANAGSLALIGSGGAVLAGIVAINKAIKAQTELYERNTEAIKRRTAAENELKEAQREEAKSIEAVADARRGGGFDAETARAAAQQAERVGERVPDLDTGSVTTAAGIFGDKGLSDRQLAEAAFLIQSGRLTPEPTAPAAVNAQLLSEARGQGADAIETFFRREDAQEREQRSTARQQATATTGASDALDRIIEAELGAGVDVERIRELVRHVGTTGGLSEGEGQIDAFGVATLPIELWRQRFYGTTPVRGAGGGAFRDIERLDDVELAELKRVLRRLESTGDGGGIVVNDNRNARFVGRDAQAQAARRINGEAVAQSAER